MSAVFGTGPSKGSWCPAPWQVPAWPGPAASAAAGTTGLSGGEAAFLGKIYFSWATWVA